ncbi:hypothetical protein [Aliicoccus persicus]|uniref:Uncharacterized protein n=1 Tax=Aliicoccus persicus TaxID=930138 RepID=A0A662Z0L7_9STAP|nr:hypothetical protein [Aliicoccus persicus]SEV82500.1 hypothetical protein SAMN05192557_0255 [Aliicoccus persicus]HJE19457.1 hypothetical protein [Aliicoccus persicus]
MNRVNIYLSTAFVIIALLYFSIMYLNFSINHEMIIILSAILFVITSYLLYKSKFKFNPINVGILLFTPLMIISLLVQQV